MTSMLRAIGLALQADSSTPASAPTVWLQYAKHPTIEEVAQQTISEYETDTRATEGAVIPGTLQTRFRLPVDVDTREFWRLLLAFGGYAFATGTHTFTFGADPAKWLTFWYYDGIAGEMRKIPNCVGNTLELPIDWPGGTLMANLEFLAGAWEAVSAESISYPTYTDSLTPFIPAESVIKKAGAAFCAFNATVRLNNNAQPLICSPAAPPSAGALLYRSPDEVNPGKAQGSLEVVARYLGYTGSLAEDARTNTEASYTLTQTDNTPATPKTATWTFPRWQPLPGPLDSAITNPAQRVTAQGPLLKTAAGALATIAVVNGVGDYTA